MPGRIDFSISVALLTLQVLVVDATYYYSGNDNESDLPGHSNLYEVTGSSGFGCQVADHELIPYRNPDWSGEDDGSLWMGETIVHVTDRYYSVESEDTKIVCNGTFYLPTVFWVGPYFQGENGADNNFAIGMLAFETNSTDKSDAWHVYRPCLSDYVDSDPPPDNTTIGLTLIPRPPGMEAAESSSPQIYFNGTFNDLKETDDYYSDGPPNPEFKFHLETDLNCTRVSEGKFDWEPG